jgi:hypothetical protein
MLILLKAFNYRFMGFIFRALQIKRSFNEESVNKSQQLGRYTITVGTTYTDAGIIKTLRKPYRKEIKLLGVCLHTKYATKAIERTEAAQVAYLELSIPFPPAKR